MDGLKPGPVDHGPAGEDWTDNVRSVIEARMMKYTQGEIQFNLMGIIQDKTIRYLLEIIIYMELKLIFRYNSQLKSISGMSSDSQMAEVARIEMLLAEEENKRANIVSQGCAAESGRQANMQIKILILKESSLNFVGIKTVGY